LRACFSSNYPGTAERKVIDISGNGENNEGLPVHVSRRKAIEKGYTINAIAVPNDKEAPPPGFSWPPIFRTTS